MRAPAFILVSGLALVVLLASAPAALSGQQRPRDYRSMLGDWSADTLLPRARSCGGAVAPDSVLARLPAHSYTLPSEGHRYDRPWFGNRFVPFRVSRIVCRTISRDVGEVPFVELVRGDTVLWARSEYVTREADLAQPWLADMFVSLDSTREPLRLIWFPETPPVLGRHHEAVARLPLSVAAAQAAAAARVRDSLEREAEIAQAAAEELRARRARYRAKGWSASTIRRVLEGEAWPGMSAEQLREAWGPPFDGRVLVAEGYRRDVWEYARYRVLIVNGRVTALQTK